MYSCLYTIYLKDKFCYYVNFKHPKYRKSPCTNYLKFTFTEFDLRWIKKSESKQSFKAPFKFLTDWAKNK